MFKVKRHVYYLTHNLIVVNLERQMDSRSADADHPHRGTAAARLLNEGLRRASAERSLSLRKIAAALGMKQATVLSHMAKGRIAIPLDRAVQLAKVLRLDIPAFCMAVLEQKAPEMAEYLSPGLPVQEGLRNLVEIVGRAELDEERLAIMREMVRDTNPGERWLRLEEIALVNDIRRLRPTGVGDLERAMVWELLSTPS